MSSQENSTDEDLRTLAALIQSSPKELPAFLPELHPADIASWMQYSPEADTALVFRAMDTEARADVLEFATEEVTADLVQLLETSDLIEVVQLLGVDEAVDLLTHVDGHVAERVIASADGERAADLRRLQNYPSDTAGGLMTTEFATVLVDVNIGDAIKELRREDERTIDEEAGIFIVDGQGVPQGWISDRDLITTPIHTPVCDVMAEIPATITAIEDQEEVAILVTRYNLQALAVVDAQGALIGVVTSDDAAEVFEEEAEEDIRRLVGTSTQEQTHLPILTRAKQRLPLQVLTVVGGLVTAYILRVAMPGSESAGGTLNADVLRYIPIIIGLAGNVGIQASTILVRAFATGEVTPDRESSVFISEALTGVIIGVVCGLGTALVSALMETHLPNPGVFGITVGVSVTMAVTWASILGSSIPMFCRRMGIDPAICAGPFLITLSDISGIAIFMLTAHLLLFAAG
jgi:magnesium transporter